MKSLWQKKKCRRQNEGTLKVDRHEATLLPNYCMQPCYATYAMSNHDVQRLQGKRCQPRLRGKVAPCLSALTGFMPIGQKVANITILSQQFGSSFETKVPLRVYDRP